MPRRLVRTSSLGLRTRAPRRKTIWSVATVSNVSIAAGSSTPPVDLLAPLEMVGAGIVGGTIVRTHLWAAFNEVNADTNPSVVTGLIMWDKTTITGSPPQVRTDLLVDWMHYRFLSPGTSPNSIAMPASAPTGVNYGMEYDIRAKRRIKEFNDSLFFCAGNFGTAASTYSLLSRVLVQLP